MVLIIASSASDSGIRPPRISALAVCTSDQVTASCHETGRSLRKTPCLLAAFNQGRELVEDGEVAAVELLDGEPRRVECEQAVELRELPPGGAEHSRQRLGRLPALRLGARVASATWPTAYSMTASSRDARVGKWT